MFLLIMGPPGSGKGTQAKVLARKYQIPHISSGDIFRQAMEIDDVLGKELQLAINKGQLVPDELTNKIVERRLLQEDCQKGFILDGYPRTIAQADALGLLLERLGCGLNKVINLDVDSNVIIGRLSKRLLCKHCGASFNLITNPPRNEGVCDTCKSSLSVREDDNDKTVVDRINVYEEKTKPLIEYYNKKKILCNIKGDVDVVEATKAILACLER
ncbi:MAG: adenylate kinase [Firmicutes bacterium]|nr:adenylate kinase [Bacillota bacterium]